MTTEPSIVAVGDLFTDHHYRVPVYQRAYAWRKDEIETLFRDVRDYRLKGAAGYYLGSLVVHAGRPDADGPLVHDVIDGQQRLTTLFLALSLIVTTDADALRGRLTFEGRDRSSTDLDLVVRRRAVPQEVPQALRDEGIREGYVIVRDLLGTELEQEDLNYLLKRVHVVRTELPAGTDLNHYFEIMNSRGEQLEKHEIVKARLMRRLLPDDRPTFATIWDACSDLSRYVQAGFAPEARSELFSARWDRLAARDFTTVRSALRSPSEGSERPSTSLVDIIEGGPAPGTAHKAQDGSVEETGRYGAVIDFPNFLLHALKVHRREPFSWTTHGGTDRVALDDKQLIEQFDLLEDADDVAAFGFTLLRVRYLFDRYVIKTDKYADSTTDDSNWVLQRVHRTGPITKAKLSPINTFADEERDPAETDPTRTDAQKQVLMAQAMFQVTDSRRAYKNYLYGVLHFLAVESKPDSDDGQRLVRHLHHLAKSRYAALAGEQDHPELDRGTAVSHYVFNYLDYKLWYAYTVDGRPLPPKVELWSVRAFQFRYRTSIEHFYPQLADESQGHTVLAVSDVDQFGNLCLMTRSDNSSRSNLMPAAKVRQYDSGSQSLKFQLMAALTEAEGAWLPKRLAGDGPAGQIERHGTAMLDLLAEDFLP